MAEPLSSIKIESDFAFSVITSYYKSRLSSARHIDFPDNECTQNALSV